MIHTLPNILILQVCSLLIGASANADWKEDYNAKYAEVVRIRHLEQEVMSCQGKNSGNANLDAIMVYLDGRLSKTRKALQALKLRASVESVVVAQVSHDTEFTHTYITCPGTILNLSSENPPDFFFVNGAMVMADPGIEEWAWSEGYEYYNDEESEIINYLKWSSPTPEAFDDALRKFKGGSNFYQQKCFKDLKAQGKLPLSANRFSAVQNGGINYKASVLADGTFEMETALNFSYWGDAANRADVEARVSRSIPCLQKVYAQNGIKLKFSDIQFGGGYGSYYLGNLGGVTTSFGLYDKRKQTDSVNLPALATSDGSRDLMGNEVTELRELTDDQFCLNFAHELSHRFGLEDEYESSGNTDPTFPLFSEHNNGMRGNWEKPVKRFGFSPEHHETFFGHLCPSHHVRKTCAEWMALTADLYPSI